MMKIFSGRLLLVRMILLGTTVMLVTAGILNIYATGNPLNPDPDTKLSVPSGLWKKQVVFAVAGLFCAAAVNLFSYRWLGPLSYWIYGAILVVLAILLLDKIIDIPFVPVINGTRRWIRVGFSSSSFQLQPSEFCKIAFILALGWYLRFRSNYRHFKGLVGPFALTLLAMGLILLEPDLGTVMLMMPVLFAVLFVAGARIKHLLIIVVLAVLASPLLWMKMHPYQRMRLSSVLLQNETIRNKAYHNERLAKILAGSTQNIKYWERNQGYQITHSKRAIASGGLWGQGYRKGPYIRHDINTKHNLPDRIRLPERQNDFIFAIIAHQFGLVGGGILLLLYTILLLCGVEIAWQNTEPFGRLVAVGIVAMFVVEVIVNVSMTLGLMPITGLTLPLVSYGGSSLLVSLIAIGLLNNIGRDRPFSIATSPFEHDKEQ
ncbi:MAG: rod shape-determining protein RodA [Sedimentisphaerales bacterium]|nr:rod shape-determining protein RodA [Sedimentisphaerales bacterium]